MKHLLFYSSALIHENCSIQDRNMHCSSARYLLTLPEQENRVHYVQVITVCTNSVIPTI